MDIKRKKLDGSFKLIKIPEQEDNETFDTKRHDQVKLSKLVHYKKEKSRNAARTRRGKENYEFYELARLLPISSDTSSQLDKASIVRLTMSHLQLQMFLHTNFKIDAPQDLTQQKGKLSSLQCSQTQQYVENNLGSMILQSLDGFLFVLNQDGRFLYVSNTVNVCLGLAQVDLVGTSIYNCIHPSDHEEVRDYLCHKKNTSSNIYSYTKHDTSECTLRMENCSFFVRMRSTLSRRGLSMKTSGYKVVHVTGKYHSRSNVTKSSLTEKDELDSVNGFIGIGHILPPPSLTDVQSDVPLFITRLDPSLTVNYCEERVKTYVFYNANEVKGQSLYHFIHSLDIYKIGECHKQALSKGQVVTPYYRWLLKNGSCIWMQSYVTMLADRHQADAEDTFVWVNYILGSEPNLFTSSLATSHIPNSPITSDEADKESSRMKATENSSSPNKTQQNIPKEEPKITSKKLKNGLSDRSSFCTPTNHEKASKTKNDNLLEKCILSDAPPLMAVPQIIASRASSSLPRPTANILDDHSKIWLNPPNKEVSNHSDLPPGANVLKCHAADTVFCSQQNPSVIHHHYPLGINPNLLHANPVLAKMLAPGFVPEAYLSSNKAIIFAAPMVKLMSPVFAPVPSHRQILPPANSMDCCPTSIADIIDELRKDPMRKVSPPNKVVLPNVTEVSQSSGTASELVNSTVSIPSQNIAPFSLQYCTNEEYILGNLHTPFVFQPITISRKFNSFPV